MNDVADGASLAEKYDTVAYAAQANPLSHVSHAATVATLLGMNPPAPRDCRVLELGCSDGANLLPMAESLPHASFLGCDIAPRAIAAAKQTAAEVALANVTFVEQDLRELVLDSGPFDYIVAHGVYSWVPAPVRDALFEIAARHLGENGVMFVSYNTYPGCHIRRAAWDILHFHVDRIEGAAARLDAARALASILAEPGLAQDENDAMLRGEFKRLAVQSDSALYHDDLGVPNDPVYFHEFVAHAEGHGLTFLAEAKLSMMTAAGLAPRAQQLVGTLDRLPREQYLDFARVRRFRQSLVCHHASAPTDFKLRAERVGALYAGASTALVRSAAEGRGVIGASAAPGTEPADLRALLEWLVTLAPDTVSVDDARVWWRKRTGNRPAARSLEDLLLDACVAGMVDLHVDRSAIASRAGDRPIASGLARWQSARQERVTNLRHETLTLKDQTVRRCLSLLDGTRDRAAIVDALRPALSSIDRATASALIDDYLTHFAKLALLSA
jgi:SAM-dependent methyltransferase